MIVTGSGAVLAASLGRPSVAACARRNFSLASLTLGTVPAKNSGRAARTPPHPHQWQQSAGVGGEEFVRRTSDFRTATVSDAKRRTSEKIRRAQTATVGPSSDPTSKFLNGAPPNRLKK